MKILETIAVSAAKKNLLFLLAGGHAVITHGFSRMTFDVDLIVRRAEQDKWKDVAQELGLLFAVQGPTFLQYTPAQPEKVPLDLILFNDDTFSKLWSQAVSSPEGAASMRVVSLQHLLALKCHAIKHGQAGRLVKDADDVIRLVQMNRLNMDDQEWGDSFSSMALPNCMKKSDDSAGQPDSMDLELPNLTGMDDSSVRVSPAAGFKLCEEYWPWCQASLKGRPVQRPEKCTVEFVL